MLTGVIKVDNLNRAWEVLIESIPDPFGPVAHRDLLYGAAPTALPGFQIEAFAKVFRRLNRGDPPDPSAFGLFTRANKSEPFGEEA
jgi:hypothetical protein